MAKGAPKGNQYSKGVSKGKTGRKSAYEEIGMAKKLADAFCDPQAIADCEKRVREGKYSQFDMMVLRGLKGSVPMLSKQLDKLVPNADKAPVVNVNVGTQLTQEEMDAVRKLFPNANS